MISILTIVLPVFLVVGAGAVLRRTGAADEAWVDVLNRYGLYIGFPALIFLNLVEIDPNQLSEQWSIYLFNLGTLTGMMLLTLIVVRIAGIRTDLGNTLMVSSFYGNVAYLGYPVVTSALPGAEAQVSIIIAIYTVVLFSGGIVVLELSSHHKPSSARILKAVGTNPFMVAVIAGFLVMLTTVTLPRALVEALSIVRNSASGVVLVSLGIFLSGKVHLSRLWKPAITIAAIRLILAPLGVALLASLFGLTDKADVTIVESAMPLAITPFALSSLYPLDRDVVVAGIFLSSILSVVTLPTVVYVLSA